MFSGGAIGENNTIGAEKLQLFTCYTFSHMYKKLREIFGCGLLIFLGMIMFFISPVLADDENDYETTLEKATVMEVIEEEKFSVEGLDQEQVYQELKVKMDSGKQDGKEITVEVGGENQSNTISYDTGDKVVVSVSRGPDGDFYYYITNYQRTDNLLILFIVFVVVVLLVGGVKGFMSMIGLLVSLVAVFTFIIPSILNGSNPIFISVIASIFLVPVTFYLSHGLKKDTTIAVAGTMISVLMTSLMASFFIGSTHITGTGLEDAFFLQTTSDVPINLPNLLIAGIIISSLGVLDDVTISQVSLVDKIYEKDKKLSLSNLYKESMSMGKNHISSMVNTLVLTYTGSSISLLLLFSVTGMQMHQLMNLETVALEIVRTLVSSIILVLSIPLTTFLASWSKLRDV